MNFGNKNNRSDNFIEALSTVQRYHNDKKTW